MLRTPGFLHFCLIAAIVHTATAAATAGAAKNHHKMNSSPASPTRYANPYALSHSTTSKKAIAASSTRTSWPRNRGALSSPHPTSLPQSRQASSDWSVPIKTRSIKPLGSPVPLDACSGFASVCLSKNPRSPTLTLCAYSRLHGMPVVRNRQYRSIHSLLPMQAPDSCEQTVIGAVSHVVSRSTITRFAWINAI